MRKSAGLGAPIWIGFAIGIGLAIGLWSSIHRENGDRRSGAVLSQEDARMEVMPVASQEAAMDDSPISVSDDYHEPDIRVYLADEHRVEMVPLETYVQGVIAGEMPLEFHPAALEAQAIAARTYVVRRLWLHDRSGVPVGGADVTNTQDNQIYRSLAEMKELQEKDGDGWLKAKEAVKSTEGEIITYGGEPIEALFFSTSNGYTENSEEVFSAKLPYLRSVESPWDKAESPRAQETVEMKLADFYDKLGVDSIAAGKSAGRTQPIRILAWTEGRRVKELLAGDRKFSGVEVRKRLGLRSAAFDWKVTGDDLILTVYGSGHGVGMSQWGAEGLAKSGKSSHQILEHYYIDARIEQVSKLVKRSGNAF
ncbi:stage II sporulation protein D [Cohnella terricola]|uniref:Stage II sporulation protein D n=1 Tax=Cohnella terricola TaxID=1289167 RepID=A0A559JB45_9BACL|nr:stage II sporulation protein D [Cohnella terricola]TVX97098.1 stage II sporulation protein D [Cohnella terricola]